MNYVALLNEFLTNCATGGDFNKTEVAPRIFIHYLDKKMKELNDVSIKFDASYLPDYKKLPEDLGVLGTEKKHLRT
jgi:hypothetical protein